MSSRLKAITISVGVIAIILSLIIFIPNKPKLTPEVEQGVVNYVLHPVGADIEFLLGQEWITPEAALAALATTHPELTGMSKEQMIEYATTQVNTLYDTAGEAGLNTLVTLQWYNKDHKVSQVYAAKVVYTFAQREHTNNTAFIEFHLNSDNKVDRLHVITTRLAPGGAQ